MTISLSIIVAMTEDQVIGKNGKIPWEIPDDMALFKKLTLGNTVVMGRKTYQSLPDRFRPLPNRYNIVVSKTLRPEPGVVVCPTIEEALTKAEAHHKPVFILGGATLYEAALRLATALHVSHVKARYAGEILFPAIDWNDWRMEEEKGFADFIYKRYERK